MMVGPWAFADNTDPVYGGAPRCPACMRFIGMKPWLPPYRVRLVEGTKSKAPADILTGPGFTGFIASDRFAREFERAGLTGVEQWAPVQIVGYNDYEGDPIAPPAVVTRSYWFGILAPPKTRLKLDHAVYEGPPTSCDICGRGGDVESYEGFVVDETSWAGADVFMTTNTGLLVVTNRFADFSQAGEFTGIHLEPADRYVPSWAKRDLS